MAIYSSNTARSTIPQELEITKSFEAQDPSDTELKALSERLLTADIDADLKSMLGKNIEELRFLRVMWGRFGQFVQRVPRIDDGSGVGALVAPIEKSEFTTRVRLEGK